MSVREQAVTVAGAGLGMVCVALIGSVYLPAVPTRVVIATSVAGALLGAALAALAGGYA